MRKIFWIRGCPCSPEGVERALRSMGIDTSRVEFPDRYADGNSIICGVPGHRAFATHVHKDFDPLNGLIALIGTEIWPLDEKDMLLCKRWMSEAARRLRRTDRLERRSRRIMGKLRKMRLMYK